MAYSKCSCSASVFSSVSDSAQVQAGAPGRELLTNSRCGQAFLASAMPISLHAAGHPQTRIVAVGRNGCACCAQLPVHTMQLVAWCDAAVQHTLCENAAHGCLLQAASPNTAF
jgi:hypothetical protein